jgi:LCP family protein required for cell wall assembly
LAAAACTSETTPPGATVAAPSPAASPPPPELDVRLVKVTGKATRGAVRPRDLARPAEAIRKAIADLYLTAFVDPERSEGGSYPSLFEHFAGDARDQARDDLRRLTLGPASAEVDEVIPQRAVLKLEFLADGHGHPVAAFAEMAFAAAAVATERRAPIRHHGDYVLRKVNGEWRIVSYDVRGRIPKPDEMQAETGEASFAPGVPSNGPMFILVVGSDARPGQSVTGTRADSLHIVGINPRLGRASIVGIPRDSWVSIPGSGNDKINASLVRGGPDLLVRTVEHLSGISIDAYVLTGFKGFGDLVQAVGGIDIRIGTPIHDTFAHAQFGRGPEHLSPHEALALSRARHDVRGGDFGRSLNQGRVMIAALATLREQVRRDPAALLPWVLAASKTLKTDLDLSDMFELVVAAPAFDPGRIRNAVAPGGTGTVAGRSVVFLGPGARVLFRDLGRDGVLDE